MIIRATDECWRKCRPAWFYGFLVRGVIPLQEYMRFQWWGECFRECGKILWAQNLELVDSTSGNREAALGRHRTWLGGERRPCLVVLGRVEVHSPLKALSPTPSFSFSVQSTPTAFRSVHRWFPLHRNQEYPETQAFSETEDTAG